MPIPKKVALFLEKTKIKYKPLGHKTVYTAFDKAATLRLKPAVIAKTLIIKGDRELLIAAVPGNRNLDKNKLKKAVNVYRKKAGLKLVKNINFISERVAKEKFKGVKPGAIPPFGAMWKLPVFVEKGLLKNPKIIINSGDYNWSIKISPTEFRKLGPDLIVGNFGKARK